MHVGENHSGQPHAAQRFKVRTDGAAVRGCHERLSLLEREREREREVACRHVEISQPRMCQCPCPCFGACACARSCAAKRECLPTALASAAARLDRSRCAAMAHAKPLASTDRPFSAAISSVRSNGKPSESYLTIV